jgi:hypothetical protein
MRTSLMLKHRYYFAAVIALLGFLSCSKPKVDTPSFDVTVDKLTYAVKEPITFIITGDAELVSFFSGEPGKEYKYKQRFSIEGGKPNIQFATYKQGTSTQPNTLSVLVSKDFNGIFNTENVQKATWVDITSRAILSAGLDNTASGVVDLTDLQTPGVPVNIAFKYVAKKDAVVAQPTWTVKNVAVNTVGTDGVVYPIGVSTTTPNLSWLAVNVLGSNVWTTTPPNLVFTGGAIGADDNEDWLISQPLQLDRVTRAYGLSIKPSPTTKLTKYVFAGFAAAGTYTVSFEATNANKWDKKVTVKELTITVQ